jgi:hypothetical protein
MPSSLATAMLAALFPMKSSLFDGGTFQLPGLAPEKSSMASKARQKDKVPNGKATM